VRQHRQDYNGGGGARPLKGLCGRYACRFRLLAYTSTRFRAKPVHLRQNRPSMLPYHLSPAQQLPAAPINTRRDIGICRATPRNRAQTMDRLPRGSRSIVCEHPCPSRLHIQRTSSSCAPSREATSPHRPCKQVWPDTQSPPVRCNHSPADRMHHP
jgi:hypothetical protein